MTEHDALNLLQPYVDGELDASTCVSLERYLAGDAQMRAALQHLRAVSVSVRTQADYHLAPPAMLARMQVPAAVATPPAQRMVRHSPWNWLRLVGAGATAAALAAIVTFVVVRPSQQKLIQRDVYAAHVRATVGERLFDVASSDRHTIKPWLSARLGYSPPVPDLSGSGYEMVGGRIDVVGGERIAVLVYRRRQHMIDVLIRPGGADGPPIRSTLSGYNLEHFARQGMSYWLVSDLNANELGDLARLLAAASANP